MRTWLLVIAVLGIEPVFADADPMSTRVALRTGVESTSTVRLANQPGDRNGRLLLGLDVDGFVDYFVLGGGLTAAADAPFGHHALRASVHGGVHGSTAAIHATASLGVGMQWLGNICPAIFRSDPCGSTALPLAELRGQLGYAGRHLEIALWTELLVDLGRDHVTSGNEYAIGGTTLGVGLTFAYVMRRSR